MQGLLSDHRRRRLLTWWGRSFRPLPAPAAASTLLFCDCEGHHGGPEGERFGDTGVDRLLSLLDRHRCRITFNVVADLCRTHPERVRRIAAAGHEIACHGWRHERPRELHGALLDEMLKNARREFASLGISPTGFRSPESAWSIELTRRLPRHGFTWNAEHDRAAGPYGIVGGLIRVPVHTDDWDLVDGTADAAALIAKWRGMVGAAHTARRSLSVGLHDWVVGRDPIFAALLDDWLSQTAPLGTPIPSSPGTGFPSSSGGTGFPAGPSMLLSDRAKGRI